MSDRFPSFAKPVAEAFQKIVAGNPFVVDVPGDDLYAMYLAAYPEGTNLLFKKNSEYDCSCCKHFIRRAGAVVGIASDGSLQTVWDEAAKSAPAPYKEVAIAMRKAVLKAQVCDLYRVNANEMSFGAKQTRTLVDGKALTWNHFHTGDIPRNLRDPKADTTRGDYRTSAQVFRRGLEELTHDAIGKVLGLIEGNALYRGEEHKAAVVAFQKAQREYSAKVGLERHRYVWTNATSPASRFRNTVIGTLVQDLSDGQDVERAVKSFETKVAPQNYKRTTALITPGMVKKAMETIASLDLESALERRFARIGDISVNDVKWVDGTVKPLMKGGIGDVLMKVAKAQVQEPGDPDHAEDISLDDFMAKVLPQTTGLEILFRNELAGNLMSLTAPVDSEPKQLFRWSNDFAWSYGGNVADSIKERVKKAGGKVDGAVLRVSLSWYNYDDLDLHIKEPSGRGRASICDEIYFRNKRGWTGGTLDVDMNAGSGTSREAVENVVWATKPPDGAYHVIVNQYYQREASDPGFVIEVESAGKLTHYTYNKAVRTAGDVHVATLHVKDGVIARVEVGDPGITSGAISQDKWGLKTEQYVKVAAVTLSPNFWGSNAVGNRHTLFVIEGCKNDEQTRGFYNEFLHPRLEEHRKVFEVIGDKTKCQPTEGQLSGLGFSSTKRESFIVKAQQGKKQRVYNVHVT